MVDSVAKTGASEALENELASPQGGDVSSQEPSASQEAQVTHLQEALSEREVRIAQLTEALGAAERLRQEQGQRAAGLEEELRRTLGQYRTALLTAAPDVPPELVQGDNVEALGHSLASAQQVVTRIRQQLEAKVAADRIPPGAPLRSTPDLSSLSPTEKILHGLRRLGQ
jgi:hypothetical protein